ncbi:MAG TPA: SDR family oxidoreductase [Steroidobacteraceae bacterium]|jgi:NAD(P)-dependent dehydrogenase (short-subunit alcohol dehydrogenase family)|nr:SDR family oxidoreductase [Steroidobacteraceae bacterium]
MLRIHGCVALVTGSNRGLGRAFCEGLIQRGAKKVYAAARDPARISTAGVIPCKLDVTLLADVASLVGSCQDVTLLINNAGLLRDSPMLGTNSQAAAREEMDTNYFGPLGLIQEFKPVLARNGGGAIVNVLSVASWFTNPFMATYCASKAAEEVLTDATRMQLRSQSTHVLGVYAGYIDTDMAAAVNRPKTSPREVVDRTLAGVESGADRVFADDRAEFIDRRVRTDPESFYADLQRLWDERGDGG